VISEAILENGGMEKQPNPLHGVALQAVHQIAPVVWTTRPAAVVLSALLREPPFLLRAVLMLRVVLSGTRGVS
jgi:hypothetical protein